MEKCENYSNDLTGLILALLRNENFLSLCIEKRIVSYATCFHATQYVHIRRGLKTTHLQVLKNTSFLDETSPLASAWMFLNILSNPAINVS